MKQEATREAIRVSLAELLFIPLFLYTYTPDKVFFWALLIIMDSYILKHYHIMDYETIMQHSSKQELRFFMILNFGILLAYGVLAFKNLALAGYLILNDLLMSALSLFLAMKSLEK